MQKNLISKKDEFDLIVLTNSPGELSALARPAIEKIHQQIPHARIILVLTPCQYASGHEIEYANTIQGISRIVTPKEYRRWLLLNLKPVGLKFNHKGIVIFLGGDLFHAVFISRRLGFKALAYVNDRLGWQRYFTKFLVPDQHCFSKFRRMGIAENKLKIIGDLMADSVHPTLPKAVVCERHNLRSDKNTITFLPGSRAFQLNFMLPFYIKIANLLAKKDPEAQFVFSVSPFTAIDDLSRFLPERSRLITANGLNYIITDEDLRILIAKDLNYEIINISTLCVTIPGTNTAQLAALGKPMVVVFPLNQPDAIPVEGLLNLITALPLIGKYIKKILAHIINENTRFFSLPNQKAGQEIVPEIRGIITAEAVADKITEQLNRPEQLNLLSTALLTIMGEKNAPQNLSEEIKSLIREDVTHK